MLNIFKRIRQKLIDSGSVTKYLLYAVGEIALVMIGILLALQVNNWNEDRREQQREEAYLERLGENLRSDRDLFDLNIDFYDKVLNYGELVLQYAETGRSTEATNWEILLAYFHSSQIWPILIESSTYDELKSSGELSLLNSVLLRDRLAFYYTGGQFRYSQTIGVNPPYRSMVRKKIPFTVQKYLWESCHQNEGDIQILINCEPGITQEESEEIISMLKSDEDLTGELRFWMSNIKAGWSILQEQRSLVGQILAEINTYKEK